MAFPPFNWDQTNNRIGAASDNDFFPAAGFLNEAGKVGLRFVNGYRFHIS